MGGGRANVEVKTFKNKINADVEQWRMGRELIRGFEGASLAKNGLVNRLENL